MQILVVAVRFGYYWVPELLMFVPKVKLSKESMIIFRSSAHFLSFLTSANCVGVSTFILEALQAELCWEFIDLMPLNHMAVYSNLICCNLTQKVVRIESDWSLDQVILHANEFIFQNILCTYSFTSLIKIN